MRPFPWLFLGLAAVPLAAAQSDTNPLTLQQAIAARRSEADRLRSEVARLGREVSKTEASLGPFADKSLEIRRQLVAPQWRCLDAEAEALKLGALLKRRPASATERKLLREWLEAAKSEYGAAPLPPSRVPGDGYDYRAIDEYAKNTPPEAAASVAKLGAYLAKGAKNDREKARAVFVWVAENMVYDYDNVSKATFEQRPELILRARAGECSGHARLYDALAKASGLKAVLLTGQARQLDSDPAYARHTKVESGAYYTTHFWNAVLIDGRWQLIDSTFANSRMKKQGKLEVNGSRRDEWFLVPPGELIYSHFPADPKWQMLERPLTKKAHAALPMPRPGAYSLGVQVWPHGTGVLAVHDSVLVRAKAPRELNVMGLLTVGSFAFPQGLVMEQRDPETGDTDVYAVLPRKGAYLLRVFAGKGDPTKEYPTAVAEYRVEARAGKGDSFRLALLWPGFREKNCYLHEPVGGILKAGKTTFRIRVPGAKQVGVGHGKTFTPLQGKDGVYSGEVDVPAGDLLVAAEFPDRANFYVGLVSYKAE